ncbi:hypothetical protein H4582DRAFT_506526 [Lactarius indigo]|nr:hypothetical protein H4582DRAFT_506526 [Lactarius indigo]
MREAIRGAKCVDVLVSRHWSNQLPLSLECGPWSVWQPRYCTNGCCTSIGGGCYRTKAGRGYPHRRERRNRGQPMAIHSLPLSLLLLGRVQTLARENTASRDVRVDAPKNFLELDPAGRRSLEIFSTRLLMVEARTVGALVAPLRKRRASLGCKSSIADCRPLLSDPNLGR